MKTDIQLKLKAVKSWGGQGRRHSAGCLQICRPSRRPPLADGSDLMGLGVRHRPLPCTYLKPAPYPLVLSPRALMWTSQNRVPARSKMKRGSRFSVPLPRRVAARPH